MSVVAVVLAGIVTVLWTRQDKVGLTISRLKTLHQAIQMYRGIYGDAEATSGTATVLGLPRFSTVASGRLGVESSTLVAPCTEGRTGFGDYVTRKFIYWNVVPDQTWTPNSVLFSTLSCNENYQNLGAPLTTKRGLAVTLDGTIIDVNKAGDVDDPKWWSN